MVYPGCGWREEKKICDNNRLHCNDHTGITGLAACRFIGGCGVEGANLMGLGGTCEPKTCGDKWFPWTCSAVAGCRWCPRIGSGDIKIGECREKDSDCQVTTFY